MTAVQLGPVVVNTTVDLVCNVTAGDLPINIVWERDGGSEIVFMGNDTTGGNTTIMIGDGDYGTYTCTGSNRLGMGSDSIEVMRAGMFIYNCTSHCASTGKYCTSAKHESNVFQYAIMYSLYTFPI